MHRTLPLSFASHIASDFLSSTHGNKNLYEIMNVDYNHSQNLHTLEGSKSALPRLFPNGMPKSILDVGCGRGTWLRAALDFGVNDVFGIDGVDIPTEQLLIDPTQFKKCDLTMSVDLGRRFEAVLCLEVAEHLDAKFAPTLIQTLTKHSDKIIFSAACPGQIGQHHVNCQWPEYWQQLFNRQGFVCEDSLRWQIWSVKDIEPWYRQNLFSARRDSIHAGMELRIPSVIHPDIKISQVEQGCMPVVWYFSTIMKALGRKLRRSMAKGR